MTGISELIKQLLVLIFTEMLETYRLAGWVAVMMLSNQLDIRNLGIREAAWLEGQVGSSGGGTRPCDQGPLTMCVSSS